MSVSASRIVSLCPQKITEVSKSCSFGYFLEGRSCGSGSSRNGLNTIIRKSKSTRRRNSCSSPPAAASAAGVGGDVSSSSEKVHDLVLKQAALFDEKRLAGCSGKDVDIVVPGNLGSLTQAYDLCSKQYLQTDRNSTFYYGTLLVPLEKRRAFWAVAVWIRKLDELVDGPNGSQITPSDVESWVSRLEHIFQGRPSNLLDAALSDTVAKFHIDIQPFKDVIEGMKMDLWKSRYKNFDELYLYTYYVSGALALITVPIVGIAPQSRATTESVFSTALAIGTATQLTNILRDVGEDAGRGRIYLPQDELAQAGLSDDDIFAGKVTDKWRSFMKQQIKRARMFFDKAEKGFPELSADSRWMVWTSSLLCRQILDEIEANDYNNFTKRARLSLPKKILTLSCAYARSLAGPSST